MPKRVIQNSFSLLNVDKVRLDKKWNYKNVISPYYRIYYIDEGRGHISSSDGKCTLEKGYMYMIPAFTLCDLHCERYLSQFFIHFFVDSGNGISVFHNNRKIYKVKATAEDVNMQNRLLEINPGRMINRSDNPKVYEKSIHYQEYEALNNKQSMSVFFETQGIMLQLLSRFLPSIDRAEPEHAVVASKLIDLLGYIQLNLSKNLTVVSLAGIVNQHPDYMSRLFLKLTGERPLAYINRQRIERSQYLITTTDFAFAEIAELTGFSNVSHFAKVFKKQTRLTPGEYREQAQRIG